MTGECIACDNAAAPGNYAVRCPGCIFEAASEETTNTVVFTVVHSPSRKTRHVLSGEYNGEGYTLVEQVETTNGEWRTVGAEDVADFNIRTE